MNARIDNIPNTTGLELPIIVDGQTVGIGQDPISEKVVILIDGSNTTGLRINNSLGNKVLLLQENASQDGSLSLIKANGTSNGVILSSNGQCYILNALAFGIVSGASSSAYLQVDSTTKGFLPPRMSTTQKNAISSPATGLVVYDNVLNKLCVYTGAAWETVTSI